MIDEIRVTGRPSLLFGDVPGHLIFGSEAFEQCAAAKYAADEAAVREMLGRWVSEAAPELVYKGSQLIGLTFEGIPVGVRAPIVVRRQ